MGILSNTLQYQNSNKMRSSKTSLEKIVLLASVPVSQTTPITLDQGATNSLLSTNNQLLPYTTVFKNVDELQTICDGLSNYCVTYEYIPNIKTFVMSDQNFVRLVNEADQILENVAVKLNKSPAETVVIASDYLQGQELIVQPRGVQGVIYKAGQAFQQYGSVNVVVKYIMDSKVTGLTGSALVKTQPLLVITVPFVTGLGFMGVSVLVGDNLVGKGFATVGNAFLSPMRFLEWTFNANISPLLNNTLGIPIILNSTDVLVRGIQGLSIKEMKQIMPNPKGLFPRLGRAGQWIGKAIISKFSSK